MKTHKEHIVTPPVYVAVALELYVFTFITVWAAYIDLGKVLNTIIALSIASIKASLVALFFMVLIPLISCCLYSSCCPYWTLLTEQLISGCDINSWGI